MQQINTELLNKFILDLYANTELKDIDIRTGESMFLRFIEIENARQTYEFYINQLKDITNFFYKSGITTFQKINDEILLKYIQSVSVKNITINKRISAIKYCASFLAEKGIITKLNFNTKKLKEVRPEIQIVEHDVIDEIMTYLSSAKLSTQIAFRLLAGTGVRRSELIRIKSKYVNLSKGWIYLDETKTGDPRYLFPDKTTLELIEQYYINNSERVLLFYNERTNAPITTSFVDSLIARIKKGLNLEVLSPHKLRHSYATWLLEHGADLETVRLLLGHRTYEMTKRYLHIKNEKLQAVSNALNPLISR